MTREEIETELLEWMRSGDFSPDPERFERLVLALFGFQYERCEEYARLCRSLDRTPDRVRASEEIPAVPTGAFKEFALRCFAPERTLRTFRTSGTSTELRGELHLDRLDLYEASLLASLRHALLVGLVGRRPTMRFLAPSGAELPDSSLSHMFEVLRREEGGPSSGFDLRAGELDVAGLERALSADRAIGAPILVAGTAFAFVHLLEAVGDARWPLPPGSHVMETGGFKGRSREIPRDALRSRLAALFAVDERSVVNQYGMTELGSQFYDSTLVDPDGPRRKLSPPWTRVRFVDPDSGRDVVPGEVGLILIQDLANTGSVAAIQTADLGRAILDETGEPIGFDVIGRAEGAEARGCSIASDVMLEASRKATA